MRKLRSPGGDGSSSLAGPTQAEPSQSVQITRARETPPLVPFGRGRLTAICAANMPMRLVAHLIYFRLGGCHLVTRLADAPRTRRTAADRVGRSPPAPAASQHFGEIEARSADLSKVDKTRAEWASTTSDRGQQRRSLKRRAQAVSSSPSFTMRWYGSRSLLMRYWRSPSRSGS